MQRTNIYLDQEQLEALRRVISEDEWQVRFAALLRRTRARRTQAYFTKLVERIVAEQHAVCPESATLLSAVSFPEDRQ